MTHPSYDDESVTTTMSEEVNAVNAAIVAAVAAGDSTAAFTTEHAGHHLEPIHHMENLDSIENLDNRAIETIVADSSRLKRPAEDDEDIEDSIKLRKLQEAVNNNANAAAQASGILSTSSLSNHTSNHTSTHNSNHNSPGHSSSLETHVPATGTPTNDPDSDPNMDSSPSAHKQTQEQEANQPQVSPAVQEALAATTHLTATSHSSIMADLERMQQLAKIDPAQLASYSTNPNNQATLEQLTSSALANVLAQAPLSVGTLHNNLQLQQQHQQQHEQQQNAVHGILASMPANLENATGNESSSSHDDDGLNGKRTSSRNMTNDERRQRRLLRNRVAAKECRKKKKAYVTELQDTCARLQEENSRLYKEVEELNAKLTLGAMRIDENVRLIKEVEELNAKLTLGVMAGGAVPAVDSGKLEDGSTGAHEGHSHHHHHQVETASESV